MKKWYRNKAQLFLLIAFTFLGVTVVIATREMAEMIKSQQTKLEIMDQKIVALEQTINTNNIDSELSKDETSSLSNAPTDIESYVFIDTVPVDRAVFLTEKEANDYGKRFEDAKNVDSFEIVPIKAMLTYFDGTQEEGYVFSCILQLND